MINLKVQNILLYYDGPQVFIGKSVVDALFICMAVSDDVNGIKYLCTPISYATAEKLCSEKIDLKSIYKNPEISDFYEGYLIDEKKASLELKFSRCPVEFLPDDGLTFDDDFELINDAHEFNSTVSYVSLAVPESKDSTRIRANKLADFLNIYQNAMKLIGKNIVKEHKFEMPKDNLPFSTDVYGFCHGSFTVKLRSSYESYDMFGDNKILSLSLKQLNTFLSLTSNQTDAVAFLRSVKGHTANSLIKLLEFLDSNSCTVKHRWSSPSFGEAFGASTKVNDIASLVSYCNMIGELDKEIVNLTGYFVAADTISGTWKFVDESNQTYKGKIKDEQNISFHGIVLEKANYKQMTIYNVVLEEIIETEIVSGKEKTKYLLIELSKA